MVGTDRTPEIIVNSTSSILEEYGAEFTITFITGIVVGLFLAYLFFEIKNLIKSNKSKVDEEHN